MDGPESKTVAMPLVASGDMGWPPEQMLPPLIEAARRWMSFDLHMDRLMIVEYEPDKATQLQTAFRAISDTIGPGSAPAVTPPSRAASEYEFDAFISYAHLDEEHVKYFVEQLQSIHPRVRVFQDRIQIEPGAPWPLDIYLAIDRCRRVVPFYSINYLKSRVCMDEFNVALARQSQSDEHVFFPIYLLDTKLPSVMVAPSYADCREADKALLLKSCTLLAALATRT